MCATFSPRPDLLISSLMQPPFRYFLYILDGLVLVLQYSNLHFRHQKDVFVLFCFVLLFCFIPLFCSGPRECPLPSARPTKRCCRERGCFSEVFPRDSGARASGFRGRGERIQRHGRTAPQATFGGALKYFQALQERFKMFSMTQIETSTQCFP